MKYFFDTEFIEDGVTIELISIGIVSEKDEYFYRVFDFDEERVRLNFPWLAQNVLPVLGDVRRDKRKDIALDIIDFVDTNPTAFWANYASYDWVALCRLFGQMCALPKEWPKYCNDIRQLIGDRKLELPKQRSVEHNALNDAKYTKELYEFSTVRFTLE